MEGRRILLAEDVEINAEIIISVLETRDILSEHAENGKIAVEMRWIWWRPQARAIMTPF